MIPSAAARLAPYFGQVGISLSNLVLGLLLIRHAAPAEYGQYVLGFSIALFAVGVQDGLVSVPVMVRAGHFNAPPRRRYLDWNRRALHVWIAALAALALLLALIGARLSVPGLTMALAGAIIAVAACWGAWDFQRGEALAMRQPARLLRMDAGYLLAVVLGAAALFFAGALGAASMLWAVAIAAAVAAALGLVGTLRQFAAPRLAWRTARLWWRRGRYSLLTGMVSWVQSQGYIYLCAAVLGLDALARIAAARLLFAPLATLLAAWVKATTTRSAERFRRGESATVVSVLAGASAAFGALVVAWGGVVFLAQEVILRQGFNGKYGDMTWLIVAWAAAFAANTARTVWLTGLRAEARFGETARLAAAGALAAVLSCLAGMVWLGEVGAVAGLAVAEAGVGVAAVLRLRSGQRLRA